MVGYDEADKTYHMGDTVSMKLYETTTRKYTDIKSKFQLVKKIHQYSIRCIMVKCTKHPTMKKTNRLMTLQINSNLS